MCGYLVRTASVLGCNSLFFFFLPKRGRPRFVRSAFQLIGNLVQIFRQGCRQRYLLYIYTFFCRSYIARRRFIPACWCTVFLLRVCVFTRILIKVMTIKAELSFYFYFYDKQRGRVLWILPPTFYRPRYVRGSFRSLGKKIKDKRSTTDSAALLEKRKI